MPIPSALVTRFIQLLINKQFAEAERELERLKQKMHKTEWNRGYFRALYGMLLIRKANNNDSYSFFAKLDLNDKGALQAYRREFLNHLRNRFHGDFDRGFFAAWAEFTRIVSKLNLGNNTENKGVPPRLDEDKSQETIEKFLGE